MTMGRKPEAINVPGGAGGGGGEGGGGGGGARARRPVPRRARRRRRRAPVGTGVPGDNFNRPTDVAWDAQGNIYVADGYGNSRIAKFDETASTSSRGARAARRRASSTSRTRWRSTRRGSSTSAIDGNNRIQVFDGEGTFKTQFVNVGAPSAICITPGPRQFLYASNSNPSTSMDNGEIYKMTLDGKIVGKFGTAGKLIKEFGSVHEMDCRSENELYVGEITNWRVQKLTLKPR